MILLASLFAALASAACAQDQTSDTDYQPMPGQRGKDVMWLPTAPSMVQTMLDVARVRPGDFVIDLGSGDGRLVIAAAKRGARARGIEYNRDLVELSKHNARIAGVDASSEFINGDIFESDLSQASVITMFLLTELNLKLRPKLLELKPGTRIVSNTFTMGAWIADQIVVADGNCQYCVAHFWIVPAQIAGRWQSNRGELDFKQSFQMISGTIQSAEGVVEVTDGRLEGVRLSFTAGDTRYLAYISGNRIEGIAHGPTGSVDWSATALDTRSRCWTFFEPWVMQCFARVLSRRSATTIEGDEDDQEKLFPGVIVDVLFHLARGRCRGLRAGLSAAGRPRRQGRDLGADAAGVGR